MNYQVNSNEAEASIQSVGDVLASMIQQLETGNSAVVGQIQEISQSTTSSLGRIADTTAPLTQSTNGSSSGSDLLKAFNPMNASKGSNILTSLFLGPVWKGIFSLFGRGNEEGAAPIEKFNFPTGTRTDLSAGLRTDGKASGIRTDSFGLSQAAASQQAPINISIQALDARSILDRSDDIAAALKQAMLSNHEINDNMNEL
jgi:hypothetical protein